MGEETQLSSEQLDVALQFAQSLYSSMGQYGYFNPFTSNDSLLRTNNNPLKPTEEKLEEALSQVPFDNELTSRYSEFMQVWDSIYNNTLNYYKGLLSYDLSWVCVNAEGDDYKSKEYKDDLKRVRKFFDKFNYKNEFDKVTNEVLKKGVSFLWFRDTQPLDQELDLNEKKSESFALQIMPDKKCKIVGYSSSGLPLYDFDTSYFLYSNVDIKLFAPTLIRKFRETYANTDKTYYPSKSIDNRNGISGQWVQTSYKDGAFCVKFDVGNYRVLPPFCSLMKNCLSNDEIAKLQKDKDMVSAYYLLAGELKTIDNAKTDKADQLKLSPKTVGAMMQLLTSGLNKNVKGLIFPAENIRGWQFQDNSQNMVSNHLKEASGQGASASELIYHTDNLSQFAMQNAVENDFSLVAPLYEQYANLLNIFVNRKTKKYKFKFTLCGLNRSWARKDRIDNLIKYADKGIILGSSQWASALGMNPCDFSRSMEEGYNSDFTDNLKLMLNINTTKDGSDNSLGGRPEKDIPEKSESTEISDDYK